MMAAQQFGKSPHCQQSNMHPLTQDLSGLSDQELANKIADLDRKYVAAIRMGSMIANQIAMMAEDYRAEHQRRLAVQMEKILEKQGTTFDKIIDIK